MMRKQRIFQNKNKISFTFKVSWCELNFALEMHCPKAP